jgi:hypothetical protein
MGDLEFTYKGNAAEQVVLQEIRLHTKADDGVDTRTLNPGTVYSVTRASDGGDSGGTGGEGGNGGNGGNNGGSGNNGNDGGSGSGGSGSGGSGGGWATVADNDGASSVDENGNAIVELTPDPSTSAGPSSGSSAPGDTTDTGSAAIEDAATPLTAAVPTSDEAPSALWWFLGGVGLTALVAVLAFILWRRRQRLTEEDNQR